MNRGLPAHPLELKTRFDDWRRTRRSSRAKNLWAKWMITLSFVIAPIILTIRYSAQSERQSASMPHAIYDSNSDHLWNRLHRAFYVRTARNGEEYGHDELDPLLWAETKHLLVGPSHQQAIRLLSAFLPPDLFQPDGPWVCVGARGGQHVAPSHAYAFSGRSVFLIFIRLPEGRSSTLNYLEKLQGFPASIPGRNPNWRSPNPNLPQFPAGTQLALVRKMVIVDNQGDLAPTKLKYISTERTLI